MGLVDYIFVLGCSWHSPADFPQSWLHPKISITIRPATEAPPSMLLQTRQLISLIPNLHKFWAPSLGPCHSKVKNCWTSRNPCPIPPHPSLNHKISEVNQEQWVAYCFINCLAPATLEEAYKVDGEGDVSSLKEGSLNSCPTNPMSIKIWQWFTHNMEMLMRRWYFSSWIQKTKKLRLVCVVFLDQKWI